MAASHLKAIATLLASDDDLSSPLSSPLSPPLSSPLTSPLFTNNSTVTNQQTKFEKKQAERIEKLKATQDRINRMKQLKRNRSPVKQQSSKTPANTPVKPQRGSAAEGNNRTREDKVGIFSLTRPTNHHSSLGQPRLMIHTDKQDTSNKKFASSNTSSDRARDMVVVGEVGGEEATPDSYIGELEEITPTSLSQFNSSSDNDELVDNELELVDELEEVNDGGLELEAEDAVLEDKGNNRRETASAEELQLTLQDYQSTTVTNNQQYEQLNSFTSNEIVFGNPNNTTSFELANVKQRAEAINIWKAQKEIEKESHHNGGRSRAREWSVLGGVGNNNRGVGSRGGRGRKSLGCVRELDTGNVGLLDYKQPEKSKTKKMVVPSFLSQFESSSTPKNENEENQENSINGSIPSTPRRCASSPSPRNNNNSSTPLSPRVALSPRNDPRSPRVALSPRVGSIVDNDSSIKLTKKKNVVSSPRNNIPPSPSRRVIVASPHHLPLIPPRTLPTPRATRASMSPSAGKERLSSFFVEDEEEENDDTVAINVETRDMVVPSTHLDIDAPSMPKIEATRDNIDSDKQEDDMIPPSTPISKVMEDAMNFLKTIPEGGGQVDVESDRSSVFFSDTNRRGSDADKKDGDNVSEVEDCDELEIAQQLAMALDKFLIQEGGDNGNNNDGYEAVKKLMSGGTDALLDVEQLALALDQFLVNDNDGNVEEEEDEAVGEVSMVKEGEDQGWTETQSKDVQVEKSTNEQADVTNDDAFTFPVNFDAFGQSSDSYNNGGESDVFFFPTSFGTDVQPPVTKKASQRPPKKSKKLTIATSFMTNNSTTVDQHKKLHPKIKICIDGAPELNITKKDTAKEENLFYINQPSPSVGDKACLLNGGPQTSSMPPSPALVAANGVIAMEDNGNSNNKPMLNLRGLLNTARPMPKRDVVSIQKGTSIHSPSMIGLLAASSSSNEPSRLAILNKNEIVLSTDEKEVVEGQFFVAPATPTMESYQQISIGYGSTKKKSDKIAVSSSSTSVGFGSAKKTRKLLQRIKKGGKNKSSSSAFGSLLND